MIDLHQYDNLGTARFVTFSCHNRRPLLADESRIKILLEELDNARQKYGFSIMGYVIMPNHVHLVIYPPKEFKLGIVIGEIKSKTARRIGALLKSKGIYKMEMGEKTQDRERRSVFWLRRCYDHNCRTPETVKEKVNYCHMNPVRAGLVDNPSEWPWSSYRWYMGYDDVVLEVDGDELVI